MTREEKRIKIAEACGIVSIDKWGRLYHTPDGYVRDCPDYFGSLDAMHEAVLLRCTTPLNLSEWEFRLRKLLANERPSFEVDGYEVANATADQRAEAFGLALNLWKEGE